MEFELRPHTHLLVVAGSRAFGVHHAESDVDLKGVAIPPAAWFHGCMRQFEQATEPEDIATFVGDLSAEERDVAARTKLEGTVFELRKFLRLASEANPNILEVLYCRDAELRIATPIGLQLRACRALFLTARARHTFAGYASAQLKRIETHRRWLLHPPEAEPTRADFDLPEAPTLPVDQRQAAEAAIRARVEAWDVDLGMLSEPERLDLQAHIAATLAELQLSHEGRWQAGGRAIGIDDNFLLLLDRERRYKAARTQWTQYHQWRTSRNAARAEGEARYGYDVKHGAHLFRLLQMCREILTRGEVHVWRGDRDADEIRAIRAGAWPYDRLVDWARGVEAELTELYASRKHVVPDAPDRAAIDHLCVSLVEQALRSNA